MKSISFLLGIILSILINNNTAFAQTSTSQKAVVAVKNLACDGDMPTIKKQLLNQDGIEEVTFTKRNNGLSTFTIMFNGEVLTLDQIHKAIEATPGCDDKSTTPYRVKKNKHNKTKQS